MSNLALSYSTERAVENYLADRKENESRAVRVSALSTILNSEYADPTRRLRALNELEKIGGSRPQ